MNFKYFAVYSRTLLLNHIKQFISIFWTADGTYDSAYLLGSLGTGDRARWMPASHRAWPREVLSACVGLGFLSACQPQGSGTPRP